MKPLALVISCEHAVNTVPEAYRHLFPTDMLLVKTHQAIDFGAAEQAEHIAAITHSDYFAATISRLLIDCNRSLTHKHCFSAWTKHLPPSEKANLIQHYYQPFRQSVIQCIEQYIALGKHVLHLSIHSFTPILHGITRQADIGLLYDPKRINEKTLAYHLRKLLIKNASYRVRMNYPYRGTSDGFTQTLRNTYSREHYSGLEIENNQASLVQLNTQQTLTHAITQSLLGVLYQFRACNELEFE